MIGMKTKLGTVDAERLASLISEEDEAARDYDRQYRERSKQFMSGQLDVMNLADREAMVASQTRLREMAGLTTSITGLGELDRLQPGGIPTNSWRMAQARAAAR